MNINITQLLETDMFPFSHSRAEGGENAGPDTWNAAMNGPRPLLNTPEEFAEFRDYVREFGAWTQEEIDAWNENECQALFLQFIAGDVRQCPAIIEGVTIYEQMVEGPRWFYDHETTSDEETGPFESRSEAYRAAANEHHGWNQTPRADSLEEIDWLEYEESAREGHIPGNLFRADDGQVFYSISN